MSGYNFLSKITGRALKREDENIAASIQEHLALLLNSRRGMTPHLAEYGLPDIHYVYYSLPHSLENLGLEIKKAVEAYEPRLKQVTVNLLSASTDTFRATYRIAGQVVEGSKVSNLTFQTEVHRDGRADTSLVTNYG